MRCKVRRAGWPSDRATSFNEVPRKLSFQEASPTLQCQNKDVLGLDAKKMLFELASSKIGGTSLFSAAWYIRTPPPQNKAQALLSG
jgi:hypothetical protein